MHRGIPSEDDDLGWAIQFVDAPHERALVVEDDGKTGYAYLKVRGKVTGDVWLYNVGQSPEVVNWNDRSAMPFQNPRRYVHADEAQFSPDSARCVWTDDGAELWANEVLWAVLTDGEKPGRSRLAKFANALARPLD